MKLKNIISGMNSQAVRGDMEIEIGSVTCDSRTVSPGDLFVAVKGVSRDGHRFISEALRRGASAIICEDTPATALKIPFIQVEDSRDALAFVSARFFGIPSETIRLIGITGTNGKTTTSYIIRYILENTGRITGLIGTIRYVVGNKELPAPFTTPDAVQFQKLLREMKESGCEYVISEVSSHALAQRRVDYSRFARAVFTNLTRDHLDYHLTMEDYLLAKRRLFSELLDISGTAVLNADDPFSAEIMKGIKPGVITYGVDAEADLSAREIVHDFNGMSFKLIHKSGSCKIRTRLIGMPNVHNLLAGIGTAMSLDIPVDAIADAVAEINPVEGRFESIHTEGGVLFIVDYAHTPDALENLLTMVKGLPHRKILTVFGCGGNRDKGKRPLMGRIASEMSDFVVITSDNPRNEDPSEIIKDIVQGIAGENYTTVVERSEAIREVAKRAEKGDVVVIAGKGHETYQEIKGTRFPMDDRDLIQKALARAVKN